MLVRIDIPEELVLVQWYAIFLLSVCQYVTLPHLSTLTGDGSQWRWKIGLRGTKEHYPCLLKFETTCERVHISSVLNFSRCKGPSIRPKRSVAPPLWLPGVFSLVCMPYLLASSGPAQKAGSLAIGLLQDAFFFVARHPKDTGAESWLRGLSVSGHTWPDVRENRRGAAST